LPFPPGHVTPASEVHRYVDVSSEAIDTIDDRLASALRNAGGSATIAEIADTICADQPRTPVLAAPILTDYLNQMAAVGRVRHDADHWTLL
jgi:anaerobic C4-dicarboxylate transporter